MTTEPTNARTPRPNGHDTNQDNISVAETQCPTCDQPISAEKFIEIEGKRRAHDAEIVRAAEARFAREMAKAEAAKRGQIAKAVKAAVLVAETKLAAVRSQQETVVSTRLAAQREKLERAAAKALTDEKAKNAVDKLRLEEKLQELTRQLTRQLQNKTAHDLGEPAEVDLYEALVAAFPNDRISRVVKGVRGPDVLVEVIDHDEVVGSIVLDSKNHARWSNKFTTKLRSDQLAEGADHAILSSSVMPAGAEQVHLQDNVIVASPARVVVLVHLLRRQIIENHVHKLSTETRTERADELYAYVVSPAGAELLERPAKWLDGMNDLEAKEVEHELAVHRKRGELIRAIQRDHEEFVAAIDRIIGGASNMAEEASA